MRGTLSVANNQNDDEAIGGPSVGHPAFRIENDEGAWSGQCHMLIVIDERPDPFAWLFSGERAYDGLSAYLVFEGNEGPPPSRSRG